MSIIRNNPFLEGYIKSAKSYLETKTAHITREITSGDIFGIFVSLHSMNRSFGENFIRLVDSMDTLRAVEFDVVYDNFKRNGYVFENGEVGFDLSDGIVATSSALIKNASNKLGNILGKVDAKRVYRFAYDISDAVSFAMLDAYKIKELFYFDVKVYYSTFFGLGSNSTDDEIISDDVHRIIDPEYDAYCKHHGCGRSNVVRS